MNEFPPKEMVKFTEEEMDAVRKAMDAMYNCVDCNEKLPIHARTRRCCSCQDVIDKKVKSDWLKNHCLDKTIEQRLRIIESWMYDHQRAKHSSPFDYVMR
jgi:hypothetical protein